MTIPFLDTNILLRHLLGDHSDHSPRATALLEQIERGDLEVRTSDVVIFETVFTLERGYHRSKAEIRDVVLSLLEMQGIILPGKRHYRQVFDVYVDLNLSFADASYAVLCRRLGIEEVLTFDRGFDRVPWIRRREP